MDAPTPPIRPRADRRLLAVLVALVVVLAALVTLILLGILGPRADGPGTNALDFLQGSPYPRMVIEVDRASAVAADPTSTALLRSRLLTYTDKTAVDVLLDDPFPSAADYDLDEIVALETAHRDRRTGGDTASLYVIYLDGSFVDPNVPNSQNALAVTYSGSSIAVFAERIAEAAGPPGPFNPLTATDVENSVLVHEAGHVLGLVNLVYASDLTYEDAQHPGHSSNQSCVMYWAIEGAGIGGIFGSPPPTDFGSEAAYDLAKLKAGGYEIVTGRVAAAPVSGPFAAVDRRLRA